MTTTVTVSQVCSVISLLALMLLAIAILALVVFLIVDRIHDWNVMKHRTPTQPVSYKIIPPVDMGAGDDE